MTAKWLYRHETNGRITEVVNDPIRDEYIAMCEEKGFGYRVEEGDAAPSASIFATDYHDVETGHRLSRPELPAAIDTRDIVADGIDAATISGLPDPCIVTIDGVAHEVSGGSLTFRSDMAGTYEVVVRHWPHLDWQASITVAEPA